MRKLLLLLLAVLGLCAGSLALRADDVADAQKAFDLFRQYSKTDDEKLLDLFAPDISVTITINSDKGEPAHDTVLPAATFRDLVQQGIARKDGNSDTYNDLVFKQEGDTVRMTCTRSDKKGFTGPFLVIYGKDASGQLKMKAMKFAVPPPDITPGPEKDNPTPTPADIPVPKATP